MTRFEVIKIKLIFY